MKKSVKEAETVKTAVVTDIWDGTFMSLIYDASLKLRSPDGEPTAEETVLGTMSPLEKRLWSISVHLKRLAMFEAIALEDAETEAKRQVHKEEIINLCGRAKSVLALMWPILRDRLTAEGNDISRLTVGVRDGWRVVAFEAKEEDSFDGFMKSLGLK